MIKYALRCDSEHEFESWFDSMAAYDKLAKAKKLECPVCGSAKVSKAIMAPNISTSRGRDAAPRPSAPPPSDKKAVAAGGPPDAGGDGGAAMKALAKFKETVEKNFDDVGADFPEEARKIHYGEADPRGIYGEATAKETKELLEEGIDVMPLPWPKTPDA